MTCNPVWDLCQTTPLRMGLLWKQIKKCLITNTCWNPMTNTFETPMRNTWKPDWWYLPAARRPLVVLHSPVARFHFLYFLQHNELDKPVRLIIRMLFGFVYDIVSVCQTQPKSLQLRDGNVQSKISHEIMMLSKKIARIAWLVKEIEIQVIPDAV